MIELLEAAARDAPSQPLIRSVTGSYTYDEALRAARGVAAGLVERGVARIGCLTDDSAMLLTVLCAAAAAGVEACPYPAHLSDAALVDLANELGHDLVVSDQTSPPVGLPVCSVDSLMAASDRPVAPAAAPPVLILTTGTTGRPKATRHNWARLIDGVARQAPEATWLMTYNPYQFAGIQVLLHVLANRATLAVPASRRPADVIAAIREFGVTNISGTPTFWRLLLMGADLADTADLPIRQITMGGEAVPADLLDQVRRAFPSARISQVYAATEFGSVVSVTDGRPGLPASLLNDDGGTRQRARLRIVDGELEVSSVVGMVGYLDRDDIADSWQATGDLVEVVEDRILFTGRKTERINVGGSKVTPHEVERVVYTVDGVALAAAYGRPNPITGAVVAVDVVPLDGVDPADLKARIRAACGALAPAARPRLIRVVTELATSGGKITRGSTDPDTTS